MVVNRFSLVLGFSALALIPSLFAEDAAQERSVTGQQNAAGSQIIINEVTFEDGQKKAIIDLKPVEQNQTEVTIQIEQK
jgi:hypothetical protein